MQLRRRRDGKEGVDGSSPSEGSAKAPTELNRAAVALAHGRLEDAARLFEAGERKLDELGAALDPDDQFEFDWLKAQLAT